MNKTVKRILAVVLSVIMAVSCVSVAFAADLTYTSKAKSELLTLNGNVTAVVDSLDELLKEADITYDVGAIIKENLTDEQVTLLGVSPTAKKVLNLVVDVRSVNALMGTIDDLFDILYSKNIITGKYEENGVWTMLKTFVDLGDIENITMENWDKGLTRSKGDMRIFKELIELLNDNAATIGKVVGGNFSTGILGLTSKDIFGENGVSGMLKESIAESVYPDDEAKQAVTAKKKLDNILYEDLIPNLTEGDDNVLNGLKLNGTTTLDQLIVNFANVSWRNYLAPLIEKLDIQYATDNALAMSFSNVVKVDFYDAETGTTTFDSDFTFLEGKPYLSQVNDYLKFVAEQFVIGDDYEWTTSASADSYKLIGQNVEDLAMYILRHADFSNTDYEEEVAAVLEGDPSFEEVILTAVKVVLSEFASGYATDEIKNSDSLYELVYYVIKNIAVEKISVDKTYACADTPEGYLDACFDICADIIAHYYSKVMPLKDNSGKEYKAGGNASFDDVVNYIANYFLFDKGFAKALGLNCTKTGSPYDKLDSLIALVFSGEQKKFNSKTFLLGDSSNKGLLKSIFTIDVQNIFNMFAVDAINAAGTTPVVKIIYSAVKNILDNLFGSTIIAAYANEYPLENAVKNDNLKTMVVNIIRSINKNSSNLIPTVSYVIFMIINDDTTVKINDVTYNGEEQNPAMTVKYGDKTLVSGKDYTVTYSNNVEIGTATAVIKGQGDFQGSYSASFKINAIDIAKATASLKYSQVPYTGKAVSLAPTVTYGGKTLVAGTDYTVKYENNVTPGVASVIISGIGNFTGTLTKTFYIRPSSPVENFKQTASTSSTVTCTWDEVIGANGYKIEVYNTAKSTYMSYSIVYTNSATIRNLAANSECKVRIRPFLKLDNGTYITGYYSTIYTANVPFLSKTGPAAVTNFKQTASTTSTVTLTWDAVEGADRYQIYRYNSTSKAWEIYSQSTTNSKTVGSLTDNTAYTIRVRACVYDKENNLFLTGDYSSNITARTAPAACQDVKVTSTGASWAKLSWTAIRGAEYLVYKYDASKGWVKVANSSTSSATVTGLNAQTSYKFAVKSYVKVGTNYYYGAFSSPCTGTTIYTQVTGLSGNSTRTVSTIGMKWNAVSGASSYQVYKYDTASKTYKWLATVKSTSYTATGLTAGTTYSFKVRAVKTVNGKNVYGELSNVLALAACPAQVTGLTASSVKGTSITFTWKAVAGANSYEFYKYNSSTKKYEKIGVSSSRTYTATGLTRNTNYSFKVRAVVTASGGPSYGEYSTTLTQKTSIF